MNTPKKILVTGANGFVGPHLARELSRLENTVIGVGYGDASPELANIVDAYIACDLTAEDAVKTDIDFTGVDAVIHLAGLSSQGQSFTHPAQCVSANSAMLINLFEQALRQNVRPRFVVVSTGALYDSNQIMPLIEESAIAFNSPYVVSKHLIENLTDYYRTRGFETAIVRPFNHTGPGQGPGFLIPDLARQILEVGEGGTLKVGNLKSRRDYSDARDIVRAYAQLATSPKLPQRLYTLGSGQSRSGEEILALLSKAAFGREDALKTEVDTTKIRPNDPTEIYCSTQKMKEDFGWEATIPLEQTISDYVSWLKEQK